MINTREDWLLEAKKQLQDKIFLKETIPDNVRISCGFCKGKRTIGLCCPEIYSEGKYTEIFIDPKTADSLRVLDILAHELIHAILGRGHGHGREFQKIMNDIGLVPPAKATTVSSELKAKLVEIVKEIGEYPHKKYEIYRLPRVTPDAEKRQSWICKMRHYEISVKNKYSKAVVPVCPICHNPMRLKDKGEKTEQFDVEDFTNGQKD